MDRPILFSAPMVRAILSGAKTQTRRIIKGGPWEHVFRDGMTDAFSPPEYLTMRADRTGQFLCCPYGAPGDRLWVKETHGFVTGAGVRLVYRADGEPCCQFSGEPIAGMKWRPSIFMRRADSRLTLDVLSVRVERLQDITEEDARAEDALLPDPSDPVRLGCSPTIGRRLNGWTKRECFEVFWRSINGPGSWDANPWVWVIGFTRVEVARV
jgi:hypothetical protein